MNSEQYTRAKDIKVNVHTKNNVKHGIDITADKYTLRLSYTDWLATLKLIKQCGWTAPNAVPYRCKCNDDVLCNKCGGYIDDE